jgi:hypothetical protein
VISDSIRTELGKVNEFSEPGTVKQNFIKSILLENNIVVEQQ